MSRRDRDKPKGASGAQPPRPSDLPFSAEERDRRLYEAVVAFQAGRYDEAEAEARPLKVPGYFPALLLLGMIGGRTGRIAEAIELLREAVALDRRSLEARNELAIVLRAAGRNDEAVAEARHAVRLKSQDAGSHNNLGLCYLASGRAPHAIEHFKRAIGLMPDTAMFHHNLGLALAHQAKDFDAIAAFRRALALDSRNAETLAQLGRLLFQHGQSAEAAGCYERAAALHPDAPLAAIHRAEALLQQGRAGEAETCLRVAIASNANSDLAHQVLGVLLQRQGRFDEAIATLERAIELQPRRISAYSSLVLGKTIRGEDAWLVQAMLALVEDGTLAAHDRSQLHFALGKAYQDLGDYEIAIGHFDRAHAIEARLTSEAGRAFDQRTHKVFVDRTIAGWGPGNFEHAAARSESERPVLIVGMPRSGTTLVEQILSSHPAIGGGGELNYWMDRQELAIPAARGVLKDAQLRALAEDYLALLGAAAPGMARATDKMPANFLVLGLIHLALPRARIIHCRRDALDTCLSIYTTPFGNPLDFAHDRADLVFFYEQYARLMAHWRQALPADRLLEIDYEALVAEPERTSRQMIAFCGLDWDDACLRHETSTHIIMTPSLWQARQPIYRSAVARWRNYEPWLGAFRQLLK